MEDNIKLRNIPRKMMKKTSFDKVKKFKERFGVNNKGISVGIISDKPLKKMVPNETIHTPNLSEDDSSFLSPTKSS